ncbi:Uncharacterised protein [Corynebacterium kutscheri]|nr:hypothetical protein [Corynebacterium kutscheri]VEH82395.1 Uncharacterised protein [Corynebacterium kutscheri]
MKQNVFKNFSTFIRFIAVCLILFMLAMMIPSVGAQDYEDSTEDIETLFDDDSVIAEDEDVRTTEEKLVSQELIVTDTIEFSSQQTDDGKFLQKLTLQVNPSLEQERALGIVSLLRTGSDIAIENSIEAETEDGEHGFVAVRLPYGEEKQLLSFDGLSFNVSGGETIVITYITDIDDSSAQWKLYSGLDSAFDV